MMTLLELITKASTAITTSVTHESDYPIVLNPDPIFRKLKPDSNESKSQFPVEKVVGWEISEMDNVVIEFRKKFFKKLSRKLKDTKSFGKGEFLDMLISYLVKVAKEVGISGHSDSTGEGSACAVVEKLGFLMVGDVWRLVFDACIRMEVWDLLESLITKGLIERSIVSDLISKLIEAEKSDLIVLSVKHLDLQAYDIMCILKHFLVISGDGQKSLVKVREYWERQALSAIDKASGNDVRVEDLSLAKDAALLIMLAHDEFSAAELCLHCLLGSSNFDNVIFSACVSKLSGEEMKALISYLEKWIRKYNSYPQVVPAPEASYLLGLEVCNWIPTLENVAKCLSMVVDEQFFSYFLHSEFHEFRSLKGVVDSIAAEARLCGNVANIAECFIMEHKDYQL